MKLIIFDIDATLTNSNKLDSKCFAETYLDFFGHPLPTIDWNFYPAVTDTAIFDDLFERHFQRKPIPAEIQDFKNQFTAKIQKNRQLEPYNFEEVSGAKNLIDYLLSKKEYAIGIATGGWKQPAQIKLHHVGIDPTPIFDAYADGHYTREAIVNDSISQAKQVYPAFEKIVYFGDAKWDVTTTRNMNIPFIGIRLRGDLEVLKQLGATQVFQDYRDMELIIKAIERATPPLL